MADDPPDDPRVAGEDPIWRRLVPNWLKPLAAGDGYRISSAAFCQSSDDHAISVVLAKLVREAGRSEADVLRKYPREGLAELKASAFRDEGNGIVPDPEADEPAHALVRGPNGKGVRKRLAGKASIRKLPPALA